MAKKIGKFFSDRQRNFYEDHLQMNQTVCEVHSVNVDLQQIAKNVDKSKKKIKPFEL